MPSSLGYAILALLAYKPQSGYDISKQMKIPFGYLWQATHGQVYPELSRLLDMGYVDFERMDHGSGPPRRVHSITPKGRNELYRWATEPPQPRPTNDELVVKAYSLSRVPRAKGVSLLDGQIQAHERRLASLDQMAEALRSKSSRRVEPGDQRFGEYAAVRRSIGIEREYIAWCRWLVAELRRSKQPTAKRAVRQPAAARRSA
jgi:DNA-binding PadR family transcriptional regulator